LVESVKASGNERALKMLFEVVALGLEQDLGAMGTDELAALATDFNSLRIVHEPSESAQCLRLVKKDKTVNIFFSVQRVVSYPSGKGGCLGDFVLTSCNGSDNFSCLPPSSIGRKTQKLKPIKVEFEAPAPEIRVVAGWISFPSTRDAKSKDFEQTTVAIQHIAAIRANAVGVEVVLSSGVQLFSHFTYAQVASHLNFK